jgi:DNA-binding XRE family transcriptional regulator
VIESNFISTGVEFGRPTARCKKCGLRQFDSDVRCNRCLTPKYIVHDDPEPEVIEMEVSPSYSDLAVDMGGAVRVMRLALGMSQMDLGKACGANYRTLVSRHEGGIVQVSLPSAIRYAEVLHVPFPVLLTMAQALGERNAISKD